MVIRLKCRTLVSALVLLLVSQSIYGCDELAGSWNFSSVGTLTSTGLITFKQLDEGKFTVLLDISSQLNMPQQAIGTAVCNDRRFTANIGGFPGKFGDLRVAGGNFVGYLDNSPLDYAFAAWEMLVVDVNSFKEAKALGFARMRKPD